MTTWGADLTTRLSTILQREGTVRLETSRHDPLLRVAWSDPDSTATGYVVIDSLVAGIATGGTRMRAGCTEDEVADLAAEMSLKTAAFDLPVGGAKGGIDYAPDAPGAHGVRLRFLQAMRPLLEGTWVTAGDLGTPQEVLDESFARAGIDTTSLHAALRRSGDPERVAARVTKAFAERVDGLRMPELIGGFGVAEAALAGLAHDGIAPRHARAAVQGFGAMGGSSARFLARAGVMVVGIADVAGLVVNTERGLDVEALLAARDATGRIDRSALRADDRERPGTDWTALDVDVLVPAAVSYTIDEHNEPDVRARLIVEAANVPVTPAAEAALAARGRCVIPDFIANTGAAAWAWWVLFNAVDGPDASFARLRGQTRDLVTRMMSGWAAGRGTPRLIAREIAAHNRARITAEYGGVVPAKPLFAPDSRPVSTDSPMLDADRLI